MDILEVVQYSFIDFLTYIVFNTILLGTCIYFFKKRKSIESILLLIGSFIYLIYNIFNLFIVPKFIESNNLEDISTILKYQGLMRLIIIIGSLSFTLGFLLLIIKTLKGKAVNDSINEIGK